MTIQEAIAEGYAVGYFHHGTKIGDTIHLRRSRPFDPDEPQYFVRTKQGPRAVMPKFYDECQVVLQSQQDLDFLRRQK